MLRIQLTCSHTGRTTVDSTVPFQGGKKCMQFLVFQESRVYITKSIEIVDSMFLMSLSPFFFHFVVNLEWGPFGSTLHKEDSNVYVVMCTRYVHVYKRLLIISVLCY